MVCAVSNFTVQVFISSCMSALLYYINDINDCNLFPSEDTDH